MSRGAGKIERAIGQALYDTDRSFLVEELVRIAYPEITTVEKKHRVAVLRALDYVQERMLLWFFRTYEARARYFISNGCNTRSYAHGLLRQSWWNRERTLEEIEEILNDGGDAACAILVETRRVCLRVRGRRAING